VAGALVLEPENGLNLSATLSAPLVNVRGWVQWQQAGDQVDVARLTAADVRRTLAVATGRAYLAVIKERRLLETARTARDNAKAHYDFTHTQLLGGIGNRLDDARAAQELTTDEVILQNQEVALFHAREALGVLVVGEGAIDAGEWTFGPMPQLSEGLDDAQIRRSDVRARRVAAKAADRTVNQAYADYLPAARGRCSGPGAAVGSFRHGSARARRSRVPWRRDDEPRSDRRRASGAGRRDSGGSLRGCGARSEAGPPGGDRAIPMIGGGI
jgi:hypothetical protein